MKTLSLQKQLSLMVQFSICFIIGLIYMLSSEDTDKNKIEYNPTNFTIGFLIGIVICIALILILSIILKYFNITNKEWLFFGPKIVSYFI